MFAAVHESGYGPKRTSQCVQPMSAFEGKADIENLRAPRPLLTHSRH
jgi:hypothetical protein